MSSAKSDYASLLTMRSCLFVLQDRLLLFHSKVQLVGESYFAKGLELSWSLHMATSKHAEMNGSLPFSFLPLALGRKEQRITFTNQQNRTCTMRIRRCRNNIYRLRSEFGRTVACQSDYEVENDGTAGRWNKGTKNRRRTTTTTKLNMYKATIDLSEQ